MPASVTRLRRWFAAGAILMIVIVAGMYLYARWRVSKVVREVPAKIGLDIQQTAEGFSISKSDEGRTLFTVSASKAVQFKQGGHAELHDVKIVVYGKDASRFDRIVGDDFEFDPKSGDVTAKGKVLIDLESNPEGLRNADQTPPAALKNAIHIETEGLVFNKNTGNATASGKVAFSTPDASGSATGIEYVSKTGILTLQSAVEMNMTRPESLNLHAARGVVTKDPRKVVLRGVDVKRPRQRLVAGETSFILREDNTVERILADNEVSCDFSGDSNVHARSDRAEVTLAGPGNQIASTVLSGNVHLVTEGGQSAEASAGRVTLHFGPHQILKTVHAEENVRLEQKLGQNSQNLASAKSSSSNSPLDAAQDVVMTAPVMDFAVKDGRQVELAETSGPPEIVISQSANNQKTVVTAGKFIAKFNGNHLASLHGKPDAKIVGISPGQPDRISTSPTLDVLFHPQGGVSSITQDGGLNYVSGTQKAWAQRGVYTATDQMLALSGSPRIVDAGLTTTAQTIRFNRATGDAIAEGDVKSTYSQLKAQSGGGMFASSDPIHVVSRTMTARRSPAVAVYSGNARMWQNSDVVEAPTLQFDRDRRSLVAEATSTQPVKTVLVQIEKNGKATPVTITSAHLTYSDSGRQILLEGGVTAKVADTNMTAGKMTLYLLAKNQQKSATAEAGTPSQVEKILAEGSVVIAQTSRKATGDRLLYTAAEDKFELTGGPPSIFDAEHGKITGDSLTFCRHDDRVLVEGRDTSPAVTRTQVAR